jgi:hypothetical protein
LEEEGQAPSLLKDKVKAVILGMAEMLVLEQKLEEDVEQGDGEDVGEEDSGVGLAVERFMNVVVDLVQVHPLKVIVGLSHHRLTIHQQKPSFHTVLHKINVVTANRIHN